MSGSFFDRLKRVIGAQAETPVYLKPGQDIAVLPQFTRKLHLRMQMPLPPAGETDGWYGGKPQMPEIVEWPRFRGEPMLFLAQLDCSRFPEDLWGGVGPREGWLLLFMTASSDDDVINNARDSGPMPEPPFRFLHITEMGPERTEVAEEQNIRNCVWLRRECSETAPVSATPFPRIPVVFEEAPGDPEWVGNDGPLFFASKPATAEAAHPVTWEVFGRVIEALGAGLDKRGASLPSLMDRLRKQISDCEAKPPENRKSWDTYQHAQAKKALPRLEAGHAKIDETRRALDEIAASLSLGARTGEPDMSTWLDFVERVSQLRELRFRWVECKGGRPGVSEFNYEFESLKVDELTTYGDAAKALTKVLVTNSKFGSNKGDIAQRIANSRGQIERLSQEETDDPEVAEYVATALAANWRCLEAFESVAAYADKSCSEAMELRSSIPRERYPDALPVEKRERLLKEICGFSTITEEVVSTLPGIPSLNEAEVTEVPLAPFDMEGGFSSLRRRAEHARQAKALLAYCEKHDALPEAVRAHFEPLWTKAAKRWPDGMGGVPLWDWNDPDWFGDHLFQLPEEPYRRHDPPFDRDNAVLLQLFTDPLLNWMWADVSSAVFIIPRANLARNDFSEVRLVVGG